MGQLTVEVHEHRLRASSLQSLFSRISSPFLAAVLHVSPIEHTGWSVRDVMIMGHAQTPCPDGFVFITSGASDWDSRGWKKRNYVTSARYMGEGCESEHSSALRTLAPMDVCA